MARRSLIKFCLLSITLAANSSTSDDSKCGLPDNFLSLPEYAQKELEAIWDGYEGDQPCEKQKEQTNDILTIVDQFGNDFDQKTTQGKVVKTTTDEDAAGVPDTKATDIIDYIDDVTDATQHTIGIRPTVGPSSRHSQINAIQSSRTDARLDVNNPLDEEDPLVRRFDTPDAPFLTDADDSVRSEFVKTWNDPDIPSEGLRTHKIQLLAVSLLTGRQLEKYNEWATSRRRVLKAREQELSSLSPAAKRVLRRLSNNSENEAISIHPKIKQELRDFVEQHKRRRALRKTVKTT